MYGRNVTLSIEFLVPTEEGIDHESDLQGDLLKRTQLISGNITENRLRTQDIIYQEQQKEKQRHDKNLKEIQFKIGDLVLLYKSQLREKKKLEERWNGLYYIHEILGNGAYKIRTLDGKILKAPVNSERLKMYHQRQ
ncbi:unnamed protein product [Rhizophagus irregularis]|nr:unnamed protein product [Rhizophagus irregularis]